MGDVIGFRGQQQPPNRPAPPLAQDRPPTLGERAAEAADEADRQRKLWAVVEAAADVSASAPARKGTYSHSAMVSWTRILRLREALKELGIS